MSEERCLGCKEVLLSDWPPETKGTKGEGVYWFRCPNCNGRNIVKWDNDNKLELVEFIAEEG